VSIELPDSSSFAFRSICESLCPKGWLLQQCGACARYYLSRVVRLFCGEDKCRRVIRAPAPFRPTRNVDCAIVGRKLIQSFEERGYVRRQRNDLRNPLRDPVFIVAAIQCFDDIIYGSTAVPSDCFVVAQPSIRLRYIDRVGFDRGIGTSFVNLGTYAFGADREVHERFFDQWLSALVKVGMDLDGFSLVDEHTPFDAGPYRGRYIPIYWQGIELGEAIFIEHASTVKNGDVMMLEFCFGLERIVWALTGCEHYYRAVGPAILRVHDDAVLNDAVRTSVLMAMTGITPRHKGPGRHMRRVAVRLLRFPFHLAFSDAIGSCYSDWATFIKPELSRTETEGILEKEVKWQARLSLRAKLGIPNTDAGNNSSESDLVMSALGRGGTIDSLANRYSIAQRW
jgi:hypothetical protein